MDAAADRAPRIVTLDIVRGVAVMGILAMNILSFALPEQSHLQPAVGADPRSVDIWAWAMGFVLVEGKMRGLFSLLFGASMLLVIDRAEAAGADGGAIHRRRMAWLLLFGLAHFFFIWEGDILSLYAVVGLVAYLFRRKAPRSLLKWSLGLFAVSIFLTLLSSVSPLILQAAASAPGADAEVIRQWQAVQAQFAPDAARLAAETALYQGSYSGILAEQLGDWAHPIVAVLMFGPETLALMLLGMWGLRSGFVSGDWQPARYRKVALICLAIALPAHILLALAAYSSGFAPAVSLATSLGGGAVFHPLMTFGYAAILVLLARGATGALAARIAAVGRAAFTNYLGTSILATFIFYGWGLGLFATIGRAELYLFVAGFWLLMLAWSKPWLDRFRFGPFEWLWRSLARWQPQPMRRPAAAG